MIIYIDMYTNCLNPVLITDIHGDKRYVPCGRCDACNNIKSLTYTNQCKIESDNHKYCLFVTLTYSNENIPLAGYYVEKGGIYFYNVTPRLQGRERESTAPWLARTTTFDLPDNFMWMYRQKFNLPDGMDNYIPVLAPSDVQLFLKRLRFNIKKRTNEKIRYFAVGEYGPVHFRPHYHLLLWFNTEKTSKIISSIVSSSWKYGRVDCSFSKGKTSAYVAQYVNNSMSVSRLHRVRNLSPFCLHSSHLGESFYKNEISEIYEYGFTRLAGKCFSDNGRLKPILPSLSFERSLYPKIVGFSSTSHWQRYLLYTSYRLACKEYGEKPVSYLADELYDTSVCDCSTSSLRYRLWEISELIGIPFDVSTYKSILYTSLKFIRNCADYNISEFKMLDLIENYYTEKDYYKLTNQLQSQVDYIDEFGTDKLYNLLFYYNDFELEKGEHYSQHSYPSRVVDYIRSLGLEPDFITDYFFKMSNDPAFVEFYSFHKKLARDCIKHKKLNDANKIFIY